MDTTKQRKIIEHKLLTHLILLYLNRELYPFCQFLQGNGCDTYIQTILCKVIDIVSDMMIHPSGRRENKREVKTMMRSTAEPAVSCCIKIPPVSAQWSVFDRMLNTSSSCSPNWEITTSLRCMLVTFSFQVTTSPAVRRPWGLHTTHQVFVCALLKDYRVKCALSQD